MSKPTRLSELPLILHLESATSVCSVCISRGNTPVAVCESSEPFLHSRMMGAYVRQCLDEAGLRAEDLDAVSVSSGPGSYTGLRVGASLAKGLCYSTGIPLIAIDTLLSLAYGAKTTHPEISLFIPMIDARRDEVYSALFDFNLQRLTENQPLILSTDLFEDQITQGTQALIIGDGTRKASTVFIDERIKCDETITCSALHLIQPSLIAYQNGDFADVFAFAPGYLKAPNITKSKKSML